MLAARGFGQAPPPRRRRSNRTAPARPRPASYLGSVGSDDVRDPRPILRKEFGSLVALDDVDFHLPGREGHLPARAVRLRQDDPDADRRRAGEADARRDLLRRPTGHPPEAAPALHRDGLPVPGRLSRHQRLPEHRAAASRARSSPRRSGGGGSTTSSQLLGLEASAGKDITQLDNGTRQKVAVAREVARQPRIILFDEPITNVDTEAKLQLKRAFKELTRRLEQTIVYVTHDQTEAMTLADQIALMQDGQIVQCDRPARALQPPGRRLRRLVPRQPRHDLLRGHRRPAPTPDRP